MRISIADLWHSTLNFFKYIAIQLKEICNRILHLPLDLRDLSPKKAYEFAQINLVDTLFCTGLSCRSEKN